MTNELSVFNEIINHSLEGLMFHSDLTNLFNFLGLKGFKKEHLYRTYTEMTALKSIENYTIEHLGYIPLIENNKRSEELISQAWYNASKFQVNENDRKVKLKEIYTKWKDWENETKLTLQAKYQDLIDLGAIASSCKVKELIKDVDKELAELEEEYIEYSAVNWDLCYIIDKQKDIKEYYTHKLKELCIEIY